MVQIKLSYLQIPCDLSIKFCEWFQIYLPSLRRYDEMVSYRHLINQSTRTPFVIHYNDMRLSNYDHLKFEHLTKYQVRYDTFDRS